MLFCGESHEDGFAGQRAAVAVDGVTILTPVVFVFCNFLVVSTGVLKLPILGGIKQCKCMVIFRDFPYNSALFWLLM